MALKRKGMVEKTTGTTSLSLEAQANESIRVTDIFYDLNAAAAEDIKVWVDQTLVQQFKVPSSWYLLGSDVSGQIISIRSVLRDLGLLRPIPVAAGETLTISGGAASSYMEATYDMYDAADVRNTEPNGSQAKDYDLFQVATSSAALAAAGDADLDASDLDSAFPAFPGGKVVPAGMSMQLLALFGRPVSRGDGAANDGYSTFVKMIQDRRDILDKDLTGFNFLGNAAHTAASLSYDAVVSQIDCGEQYMRPTVKVFNPPILFEEGDELNIKVSGAGAGMNWSAGDPKLGLLLRAIKI